MISTNIKAFKWWYAIGITKYTDLLEEQKVTLIAMTEEKELLNHYEAHIHIGPGQVAIADCGEYGNEIYLLPLQWLSTSTDRIIGYWLTIDQRPDTQEIPGIITAIEDGQAVKTPTGTRIWGTLEKSMVSFISRPVCWIIPIRDGKGTCIAWEGGGKCSFISDREADELTIKINLKRLLS